MAASGLLFLAGSLPSILPFVFITSVSGALVVAKVLSLLGLFVVGATKASVAKTSRARSGLENMAVAGVGGLAAWFIGQAFGATIT